MLTPLLIFTIVMLALAGAVATQRRDGLISRRPYNNRYNDATGARDDRY